MPITLTHCPAPAKLNLFLHITGRRSDGYHLLQTVFQLIDYSDILHFELRTDHQIQRVSSSAIPQEADLTVRAAKLLQTRALTQRNRKVPGVNIAIEKYLPMGGGLGGGSSDAATTLIALNHLWETHFTRQELMDLSLQLGADVPIFVFGQNAFAEGIGEVLTPVTTRACWFVVIEPGVSVATAGIFGATELTRNSKPVTISDFSTRPDKFGKNDLQAVAVKLFPEIGEVIEWLSNYGDARMSGSGACVFCAVQSRENADAVLAALPRPWKGWKTKAIAQHPLAHLLPP